MYEYSTSWPDDGIGSEWQIAVCLPTEARELSRVAPYHGIHVSRYAGYTGPWDPGGQIAINRLSSC